MDVLSMLDLFQSRVPRMFLDRTHYDGDSDFQQRFRMTEDTYEALEEVIGPRLRHQTQRNHALSPREQILSCIRFYSTNGFYHVLRDAHGPSESTMCRCINEVTSVINDTLFDKYVRFPQTFDETRQRFYEIANMPSVAGIVDGTLIKISKPRDHEEQFVDRNGDHSLNVMLVSGSNNEFFYCNSSWPGSVNDARVLRNSNLYYASNDNFRLFPGSVILGDSIYPCLDWLIPPVLSNPNGDPVVDRFNKSHRKTRSIVERSIGILKNRFPCLKDTLRVKSPTQAAEIVKACVTLHNFCIAEGDSIGDADAVPQNTSPEERNDNSTWHMTEVSFLERTERRSQLINSFR